MWGCVHVYAYYKVKLEIFLSIQPQMLHDKNQQLPSQSENWHHWSSLEEGLDFHFSYSFEGKLTMCL